MESFEELQELYDAIFGAAFDRHNDNAHKEETRNNTNKCDIDENSIDEREKRIKDLERENKQLKEKIIILNQQSRRNYKRYIDVLNKLNSIKDIIKGGSI